MNLPKVIIFDVGGTLVNNANFNFEDGLKYLYNEVFDTNEKIDDFMTFCNKISKPFFEREGTTIEISFQSFLNYLCFIYPLKKNYSNKLIEKKFAHYVYQNIALPSIKVLLKGLKKLGIPLYILSNSMFSSSEIKQELKELELDHYFQEIISTADYLYRKPSTQIFEMYIKRLNRLGYENNEICYIGNDYKNDIEPAIINGIKAIHYHDSYNKHDKYLEIADYLTLVDLWGLL